MVEVKRYIAEDGREFKEAIKCLEYEAKIRVITAIMSALPLEPSDMYFLNGHGYVQHDKQTLLKVESELRTFLPDEFKDIEIIGNSLRYLDSFSDSPLYKAIQRFCCIDSNSREWGQPFYALHPDEARSLFCINPEKY